jgi:hypothetical protein
MNANWRTYIFGGRDSKATDLRQFALAMGLQDIRDTIVFKIYVAKSVILRL